MSIGKPFAGTYLALILTELGDLQGAREALDWTEISEDVPERGPAHVTLLGRAILLRLKGEYQKALEMSIRAGEFSGAAGILNPALIPWRSEAAQDLFNLGAREEAIRMAEKEVCFARRWGAPGAIGHSLRILGKISRGNDGKVALYEATEILSDSNVRLEYAKTLRDLGVLERRDNLSQARAHFYKALDLANQCNARRLISCLGEELKIAGAWPRRRAVSGPSSLTPSETRVALLAADGKNNREIAQDIYVTTKTVEAHLGNVYRKLSVKNRKEMKAVIESSSLGLPRSSAGE